MGSKTIDLEIAVLHKTIKTPQQYFHTESLLAAMAKPLPAPRTPGVGGTGCGPKAPIFRADKERPQAAPGRAEQLQRLPRPGTFPSGPSERGAAERARGRDTKAERRTRRGRRALRPERGRLAL